MAHQQQRPFLAVALDARDDICAIPVERNDLRRNAVFIENRLDVLGSPRFVPRRITRGDANERLKIPHGLIAVLREIRRDLRPHCRRNEQQNDEQVFVTHRFLKKK